MNSLRLPVPVDDRPLLIAIAGPNGAGKSTFYEAHLRHTGLPFVNADVIARATTIGAYEAAALAAVLRRERLALRESFIFETVFSDPLADKISFLAEAATSGYNVILIFVGLSSMEVSIDRVGMRVLEGGHSVPLGKLETRFPRTIENLRKSMALLPLVLVYDNDDLRRPFRFCAATSMGAVLEVSRPLPTWLTVLLPENYR